MIKKQIFIDFDGVLIDSSYEAFIVFCLAKKINITKNLFLSFKSIRNKIVKAWQYNYINKENDKLFLKKINTYPKMDDLEFEKNFFFIRSQLRIFQSKYWFSLHNVYKFTHDLVSLLALKKNHDQFKILTHKDIESVDMLIRNLIPDFQKISIVSLPDIGANVSKLSYLKDHCHLKNFLFIDDNEITVNEISFEFPESKIYLPDWGYNDGDSKFLINNIRMIKVIKEFINEY